MVKFDRKVVHNFIKTMKHYVCTGECRGASDVPKNCESLGCHKKGEPLTSCECEDRKHGPAFEKKRREMGSGKKNGA